MDQEREKLRRLTIYLEEGQVEALDEVAEELMNKQGGRWSRSAVVRLAVNQFLISQGRMV